MSLREMIAVTGICVFSVLALGMIYGLFTGASPAICLGLLILSVIGLANSFSSLPEDNPTSTTRRNEP